MGGGGRLLLLVVYLILIFLIIYIEDCHLALVLGVPWWLYICIALTVTGRTKIMAKNHEISRSISKNITIQKLLPKQWGVQDFNQGVETFCVQWMRGWQKVPRGWLYTPWGAGDVELPTLLYSPLSQNLNLLPYLFSAI